MTRRQVLANDKGAEIPGRLPSPNQKTNPHKEEGWGGVSFNPLLNSPAQNSACVPPETQSHMLTNGWAREWKEPGSWWLSLHGSSNLGCHSGLLMWETLILGGWIYRQGQTVCDNRPLIHILSPGSQTTIYSSGPRMVRILSRVTDNCFCVLFSF